MRTSPRLTGGCELLIEDSQPRNRDEREILDANLAMSQRTVGKILQKLQAEGGIEKVGAARATRYRKVR